VQLSVIIVLFLVLVFHRTFNLTEINCKKNYSIFLFGGPLNILQQVRYNDISKISKKLTSHEHSLFTQQCVLLGIFIKFVFLRVKLNPNNKSLVFVNLYVADAKQWRVKEICREPGDKIVSASS